MYTVPAGYVVVLRDWAVYNSTGSTQGAALQTGPSGVARVYSVAVASGTVDRVSGVGIVLNAADIIEAFSGAAGVTWILSGYLLTV